jgi:hypothetical protein
MTQLRSRHLFTITIKLHAIEEIGNTPAGTRRVFPVAGGDFAGERLRGTILPVAGSDLLLTRADGSSQQDVRMILRHRRWRANRDDVSRGPACGAGGQRADRAG